MHFAEQDRTRVDPHPPQCVVQHNHRAENLLRNRASFRDFLKKTFVNQIKKLRHYRERGDVALVQSPQQLGGIQRFQVDDTRSLDQRQQQICHLRQHVKQGQHAQQRVVRPQIDPVENRFHFGQKVRVRQHHALGVGGCA